MSSTRIVRAMCKWSLAVTLLLLVPPLAVAASPPDWLKKVIADESNHQFDKRASSAVLYESENVRIHERGTVTLHERIAIRVLSPSGVGEALLRAPVSSTHKVDDLRGWLIRGGRVEAELDKKDVAEVDLTSSAGYYDDNRTLVAALPGTRTGDLVAYEYDLKQKDPLTGYHQSFIFQVAQPVVRKELTLETPFDWKLHLSKQCLEPVEYSYRENVHTWTATDLEYRPEEPLMPPWDELSRRLTVVCYSAEDERAARFANWQAAAGWVAEIEASGMSPDPAIAEFARTLCGPDEAPEARFRSVAEFVRDQIRYVAVEIGIERFQPRPAGLTLANRYGDCKDKVALTRALLEALGIPSSAVLVNATTRIDPDCPSPFVFNHAIVAVPLSALPGIVASPGAILDSLLFFDPTDDRIPVGSLSRGLRGKMVLVCDGSTPALRRLPPLEPADCRQVYRADLRLDTSFSYSGSAEIASYGVPAAEWAASYGSMPPAAFKELLRKLFTPQVQKCKIDDLICFPMGDSTIITFKLSGSGSVVSAGDYRMLRPDIFHEDSPEELTDRNRVHPIDFGDPHNGTISVTWRVPPEFSIQAPPPAVVDSCRLASIECHSAVSDSTIVFDYNAVTGGGVMPTDKYSAAQAFNRSLHDARRMRLMLIRQSEGTPR